MKKRLEITLMSDLCAGVGKHFAATIDLDTATDEYGIPFIPSRRLKGCMREVAEMLCIKNIDAIFGKSGSEKTGSLLLTDARIENYKNTVEEIKSAKHINPASITELFCSVRGETAIERDTVKDGSLRFIRVVNKFSPIDSKPLKFIADIEFDDDLELDVKNICKGIRNIGYHRNRGLGAVCCRLVDSIDDFSLEEFEFVDGAEYKFSYLIQLQNDLMLPSSDSNHTLDYIPGTSVMGALASRYKEPDFNDVFLSGKAHFENLYLSDEKGTDYFPAPRFLAKIKAATKEEDKGIKNLIAENDKREKNPEKQDYPQYKPLKNGYINPDFGYKKPKTKIVYHNAVCDNGTGLYTQHCLCGRQFFKGSILADGKTMKKIYPLFKNGTISFGKSKTAQYARCKIISYEISVITAADKIKLSAGQTAAYICESDIVLTDENGIFTAELSVLLDNLGISTEMELRKETSLATRTISGYNSKWNLKKPQFPVICAGSVVVFRAEADRDSEEYVYIGEKQNEGFGKIKLLPDAAKLTIEECFVDEIQRNGSKNNIFLEIEKRRLDDKIIEKAIDNCKKINLDVKKAELNSSQIGRLILMCKQAESYDDFMKRVSNIKTDSVKGKAIELFGPSQIKSVFECLFNDTRFELLTTDDEETDKDFIWNKHQKYIITLLTVAKYKLREKVKESE